MTDACTTTREVLVAFLRGELKPLERTRIDSHLAHCSRCAALRRELSLALAEASALAPTVDSERLQYLAAGLAPYAEARQDGGGWRLATLGLAFTSVALLAALGLVRFLGDHTSAPAPRGAPGVVAAPIAPPLRLSPSPFVRLLATANWDGLVTQEGRRTEITLTRGVVAIAFAGGKGRRLRVVTPAATIDVVGTRFFVDARVGSTLVGVVSGRVRVLSGVNTHSLSAGDTSRFWADAPAEPAHAPAAAVLAQHEFLASLAGESGRARARDKGSAPVYVLDRIAKAEALALAGKPDLAIAAYEKCAGDPAPDDDGYRDQCRYELARLYGFTRGDLAHAKRILRELKVGGGGELRALATLALCELDLAHDPCGAAFCLGEVVEREEEDSALRNEALQLMERWDATARCGEAVAR